MRSTSSSRRGVEAFAATWLIVSAGFDAHRSDPITELGLASGDYVPLTRRGCRVVPPGRRLVMLEGGYDLDALACGVGHGVVRDAGRRRSQPVDRPRPTPRWAGRWPGRRGSRAFWNAKGCCDRRSRFAAGAARAAAADANGSRGRPSAVPGGWHGARPARRSGDGGSDVDCGRVDFDATTDARPDEIKQCLHGWADAMWTQGERFGTIGARSAGRTATALRDHHPSRRGVPRRLAQARRRVLRRHRGRPVAPRLHGERDGARAHRRPIARRWSTRSTARPTSLTRALRTPLGPGGQLQRRSVAHAARGAVHRPATA